MNQMLRSWLFAPANKPSIVAKAQDGEADAIIIDLEDAVPIAEKVNARQGLAGMIDGTHRALFIRTNALSTPYAFDDVAAIAGLPVKGIMLPKAESACDIQIACWLLTQFEAKNGKAVGHYEIIPLIETASGVATVQALAAVSPRVRRLAFGAGDYTLDLSIAWSRDETELLPARSAIVLASRIAGLEPPLDAAWVDIADSAGMDSSAGRARDHGFQGKLCIHPHQVRSVNRAYEPTPEEITRARLVVQAFDKAEASGDAAVQIEGKMVDYPIALAARRVLTDAERMLVRRRKEGST